MAAGQDLSAHVALVTGASRGIGAAVALMLAEAGAAVAVNYRERADAAEAVVAKIAASGGRAIAVAADVSQAASVAKMVEQVARELGPIDILVNNAGVAIVRGVDDLTEDDFDRTIMVNLKSAFLCTQAVLPAMRARKWGRIVNITSGAARGAGAIGPHYNASKAGMEGLTRGYAARLVKEGITVNNVAPSLIETDMMKGRTDLARNIPLGRMGQPEEVAQAVAMVLGNAYMTGQTIILNGGMAFIRCRPQPCANSAQGACCAPSRLRRADRARSFPLHPAGLSSMEAIFRVDGNDVVTSPYAAGPWNPDMQHGSPPASLVVWAAERIPTAVPMRVARVTVDLMRPVPVAPLTIESDVVREGRKIQLCAVRLLAKGVVVVSATVLKIRVQADELPPEAVIEQVTLPGPEQSRVEHVDFSSSPFVTGMSLRAARGHFGRVRAGRDLVSRRPADRGGRSRLSGDADDGGGGFLQRHFVRAGFPRLDLSQRRPDREFFARAGRRLDPGRCRDLDRPRRRGPRHGEARRYQRLFRPRYPDPGHRKALKHDPEKWEPVFRKDHAQTKWPQAIPGRPPGNGRSRPAPCPRSFSRRCVRSGRN